MSKETRLCEGIDLTKLLLGSDKSKSLKHVECSQFYQVEMIKRTHLLKEIKLNRQSRLQVKKKIKKKNPEKRMRNKMHSGKCFQ